VSAEETRNSLRLGVKSFPFTAALSRKMQLNGDRRWAGKFSREKKGGCEPNATGFLPASVRPAWSGPLVGVNAH